MLPAHRVSLDPHEHPEGLSIWIGPDGARSVRGRDSLGHLHYVNVSNPRQPLFQYPGFLGYEGAGFFLHQCQLLFDHESIAPPNFRAGQLIISGDKASLAVTEGAMKRSVFVGLIGERFNDVLFGRQVRNAIVVDRWAIAVDDEHGGRTILHQSFPDLGDERREKIGLTAAGQASA